MNHLVGDPQKCIVVLVNDFNPEFGPAFEKLQKKLDRELKGVLLVDATVKAANRNKPDTSGYFKEVVCDFQDPLSVGAALKPIRDNILLITCSSESNQPFLKQILPYIPTVFGPTESSIDWSTHKHEMRQHLESYNSTLTPKYRLLEANTPEAVQEILDHMQFPMIVKPNGLAASILVTKTHNEQELRASLDKSFKNLTAIYKRDKGRGKPSMIVEEFIVVDMYSVDS